MASSNAVWRIFHVGSIFLGFCFFFKCFTCVWKRSNFGWLRSFPAFLAGFFISRIFFSFFFFKDFLKISDGFSPNSGRIPQNWRPFCRWIFHKYLQMFPGILKDFFFPTVVFHYIFINFEKVKIDFRWPCSFFSVIFWRNLTRTRRPLTWIFSQFFFDRFYHFCYSTKLVKHLRYKIVK